MFELCNKNKKCMFLTKCSTLTTTKTTYSTLVQSSFQSYFRYLSNTMIDLYYNQEYIYSSCGYVHLVVPGNFHLAPNFSDYTFYRNLLYPVFLCSIAYPLVSHIPKL